MKEFDLIFALAVWGEAGATRGGGGLDDNNLLQGWRMKSVFFFFSGKNEDVPGLEKWKYLFLSGIPNFFSVLPPKITEKINNFFGAHDKRMKGKVG